MVRPKAKAEHLIVGIFGPIEQTIASKAAFMSVNYQFLQSHTAISIDFEQAELPVSSEFLVLKRVVDFTFALLMIVLVLSWLVPLLCLLIIIDSSGKPMFKQKRSGKDGHVFGCYKLRTMRSVTGEFQQATRNDPRITTVGSFLRKTNLDELPQFFNVLKGEMSLVGPRPHPIELDAHYIEKIPEYRLRWRVLPGITGLAQSKGYRGETVDLHHMSNRIKLDNFYISHRTMTMDIGIFFRTLYAMAFNRENAY